MQLLLRLVRALWIFGLIFSSYMVQLGLRKVFARWQKNPDTGREERQMPEWLKQRRKQVDEKNAKRLLAGMLRLRGVYIKMGQVLSIMGGFLPRAFTKELESLQDDVPPHPYSAVERTFSHTLGKLPTEAFETFSKEPLAAASLGQVHEAYTHDGQKVAVKILYPQIREIIAVDMKVIRLALKVYKWFFPFGGIERVHDALVDLLKRETDYEHEADCMTRMAKNFSGEADILFPEVLPELTNKDILTMTFMEGVKISRLDEYERLGIDPKKVATRLVQSFYKQLFVDRFFHADPHPGNFLVQAGEEGKAPKIVVLDFGAISEVGPELVDGALEILQGMMTQNGDQVLKGFRQMGFVGETGNKELLEETVMSYFQKLLKIKDRTPQALMNANQKDLEKLADPEVDRRELRELMRSFDYPDGWFYVERASVLMFWLTGQIDPTLDSMSVGVPYVMPLLMQKAMGAN